MGLKVHTRTVPLLQWRGCYEKRWQERIVPAAFVHPAKMSRALLVRIYNHLIEHEMLQPGNTVLDPFAGIGTTAIEGAHRNFRVIAVELEPKFVELARDNVEKYRRYWTGMGYPLPVIVQGDSRQLRQVLSEADVVISSPPYIERDLGGDGQRKFGGNKTAEENKATREGKGLHGTYGRTEGQLGAMPSGDIMAVISSPPYAEIATGAGGLNTKPPQHDGQQAGRSPSSASQDTDQRYGQTEGQMARMEKGEVDAVITVPPYEGRVNDHRKTGGGIDWTKVAEPKKLSGPMSQGRNPFRYGRGEGQMGAEQGDTFWAAAHQVVQETYALLKPGGVAVWVVKAFVRDKQLVDFPGDWRKLCEHVGFETQEEIHALFTMERTVKGKKVAFERKSFFRRLAEQKGSPRVDWETVWIMQKPEMRRRGTVTWR